MSQNIKIILAEPRGFCAGVERAIAIVNRIVDIYGDENPQKRPIVVLHEIVHNKRVLDDFINRGVMFIENIDDVPDNAILVLSAHGVSEAVEHKAKSKGLTVFDATCPLVSKVHKEGINLENMGYIVILIGHKNHPEVVGTLGRMKNKSFLVENISVVEKLSFPEGTKLSYITQTTLSVDEVRYIIEELKSKFPNIKGPNLKDICYATQNRQNAVKILSTQVDVVFVIGSKNSSNSNSLRKVANEYGILSYLIDDYRDINLQWLSNCNTVGITAGASTPSILVDAVITFLGNNFNVESVSSLITNKEDVHFKFPQEL